MTTVVEPLERCQGCDKPMLSEVTQSTIKPGYCFSCVEGSGNRSQRREMRFPKNSMRRP